MHDLPAQQISTGPHGYRFIEGDWYPAPLPDNLILDGMSYPDTAYSFSTFHSRQAMGMQLGFASGNYGHGIFTTGYDGQIVIGKYVVLQCTRILANRSVIIRDHCMFSWGSVITDSWLPARQLSTRQRRAVLEATSHSPIRHPELPDPQPVLIEENVWVGFEAIILPGVTVGRGAVVGCKAVVTESIPPYAVVVGNPARIIRFLSPNDTEEEKKQIIREFM